MELAKVYSHAFEGVTTISMPSHPNSLTVETVRFSPLSDENILFYFEASNIAASAETVNTIASNYGMTLASLNWRELALKLIKQPTDAKCTSLVMNVDVMVYYSSSGALFKHYKYRSGIKVDQVSDLAFETVIIGPPSLPMRNINPNNAVQEGLTLKFKMFFNDDTSKSAVKSEESSSFFNLKNVYESNVFADFSFKVGDVSFPVHKVILAAHSPVFMKMWTIDCLESKEDSVAITDARPEMFVIFLKYLYSGEIEDKSWPSVKELYYLAEKYDVGTLKNECTALAISFLDLDHVCDILKIAYTYNDSNLKLAAKKFAADHIKELRKKEDWKNFEKTHLLICYEITLNFIPE